MVNDKAMGYTQLQSRSDEELCACAASGSRAAEEILAHRYYRLVRSCARPYFLAGGDVRICCRRGCWVCSRRSGSMTPGATRPSAPLPIPASATGLCTALRAASAGKHSPLNQSVPLHPAFFDANTAFAQVDPEVLLIDREKTANLLDSAHKLLSEFEVKVLGFYLDGLTCREISETVGKSPKSVDNAVQRIRRKIARQLSSGDISKS